MKKLLMAIVVGAALTVAGTAQATTLIDFAGGITPSGTVTLTNGQIIGTQIHIGVMTIENTPNYPGTGNVFSTVDAYLNFNSGTAGQNFTIVGSIGTPFNLGPATLLSGRILGWEWNQGAVYLRTWGPDTKNADLLTAVGLPTSTPFEFAEFNLYGSKVADSADTYTALSYDVRNTAVPVPEPGSMLLLGTGLFGLAGAVRRRMKK